MYFGAKPELFRLAQNMRNNPTKAENILWKRIKQFRKDGYIFRKQHPMDIFIADFYCHKLKLVIEVDGEIHSGNKAKEYDDSRSGELERFGIIVLRFKNEDVLNNLDIVINKIINIITESASPALLGAGDGRG